MSKRKFEDPVVLRVVPNNTGEIGLLNSLYYNELNLDSIKIYDGRIIFHSTVTSTTITKLFEFIKIIMESSLFDRINNRIYIHIISRGGELQGLYDFLHVKSRYFPNIELVSVMENTCTDVGFMLASLCNYRIIKKNVICYMNKIDENSKYWGLYEQGENLLGKFDYVISNTKYKVTKDKILKYIKQANVWNAKKMVKIGFMDEII
jgi:hypothetical protein|tara:strand:- start:546 stop:1163 length:618 start_codon:yes stop_codon:yes gene_type:complete